MEKTDTATKIREDVKEIARILLDKAVQNGMLSYADFIPLKSLEERLGSRSKEHYVVCCEYMNFLQNTYGIAASLEEQDGVEGLQVGIRPTVIDFLVKA